MANVRSRLAVAAWAVLSSGAAFGAACPVDPVIDEHTVISGWPTDRSPADNTWTASWVSPAGGVTRCGYAINTAAVYGSPNPGALTTPVSLSAGVSEAHSKLSSISMWTGDTETYMATCSTGTTTARVSVVYRYQKGGNIGYAAADFINTTNTTPCDPPPLPWDCTEMEGDEHYETYEGVGIGFGIPSTACVDAGLPGEQCMAIRVGVSTCFGETGGCIAKYRINGAACTKAPESPEAWEGEKCVPLSDGKNFCVSNETKSSSCGWVNSDYVCLENIYPDGCKVLGDGSRICGGSAPTPPAPDSGTPGDKAAPDGQAETDDAGPDGSGGGGKKQYDVFDPATAEGSSRDPGDGSNPASGGGSSQSGTHTGNDSDGDGEADPTSKYPQPYKGTASGGATCEAPPTCTHGDPVQCAQLYQTWRAACAAGGGEIELDDGELLSGIGATDAEKGLATGPHDGAVSGATGVDSGGFIGGASCPSAPSITVMGQTIDLQQFWDTACQMAVLFAPIVQAMGALLAAMVIFRTNWG